MTRSHPRPAELRRDHARPRTAPAPTNAVMDARLKELLSPATYALRDSYHRLGLRERVLTLPVMLSLVVTLIWRQVPSVSMLAALLRREHVLWTAPLQVRQQALNERLRSLPPALFQAVLQAVLPTLAERAAARTRPRPAVIEHALQHFSHLWAVDGTTLEPLFKKVGLLRDIPTTVLAGKLLGILDVASKLPVHLTWDANPATGER